MMQKTFNRLWHNNGSLFSVTTGSQILDSNPKEGDILHMVYSSDPLYLYAAH